MPSKPMLYKVLVEYEVYVVATSKEDAVYGVRKAQYDVDPRDYAYAELLKKGEYIDPDWTDSVPYLSCTCGPQEMADSFGPEWDRLSVGDLARLQEKKVTQ